MRSRPGNVFISCLRRNSPGFPLNAFSCILQVAQLETQKWHQLLGTYGLATCFLVGNSAPDPSDPPANPANGIPRPRSDPLAVLSTMSWPQNINEWGRLDESRKHKGHTPGLVMLSAGEWTLCKHLEMPEVRFRSFPHTPAATKQKSLFSSLNISNLCLQPHSLNCVHLSLEFTSSADLDPRVVSP